MQALKMIVLIDFNKIRAFINIIAAEMFLILDYFPIKTDSILDLLDLI